MAEKKKKTDVHLMHCSLHASSSSTQIRSDMEYALHQNPLAVSFTEMAGFHDELRAACRANSFTPVEFTNNIGECFAVNNDLAKIKDKGNILAHPAGPDRQFARYINWVTMKVGRETVWYHTGHWLAHLDEGEGRVKRHNMMSQQMAAQVRKHAQGDDVVYFSGDFNLDDQGGGLADGNQIFRSNGLLTIWDEFKVYPSTLIGDGRTIDIIGRYVKDGRNKGVRYKVYPRQNSDHRFVAAWYEITDSTKTTPGGTNGGGNGGGGVSPAHDPYATGGSVDWSDYYDNTEYDLSQAVDDSDGPQHGDTISD